MAKRPSTQSLALLLGLLLTGNGACGSTPDKQNSVPNVDQEMIATPASTIRSAEQMLALYDTWDAAVQAGNFDELATLYSATATFQTGNNPVKTVGGKAIAENLAGYGTAFPDLHTDTISVLAKEGWLAALTLTRGTNTGAMMGMDATNKKMSFLGLQTWRVDDAGKIETAIAYADNLNFLGQMGMWEGEVRPVDEAAASSRVNIASDDEQQANRQLAESLTAAVAAKDAPKLAALYHESAVLDDVAEAKAAVGRPAVTAYWTSQLAQFPDLRFEKVDYVTVGDFVVVTYSFVGTNTGDLPRFQAKATGKAVDLVCAALLKIRDGKIARHDLFMDGMSMGYFLGLVKI